MARVSRKQTVSPAAPVLVERVYCVGLYVRLSKEDNGYHTSDSIQMQQCLLEQYVKTQQDMKLVGIFCDNGATGTDFDRPDFERMMEAVRRREIDCIVVKDLSRFGRNYVETGYYLEKIFPFLGVRFVAVNDCYDTLKCADGDEMVVSLKNIVNSLFAKDISKKSGTALRRKQEKGEFIGSWTPYGYLKSPEDKNHLIIDPETAPIVRDIFTWRLEGLGYDEIAKRLNEQKILCPTMVRFLRGEFKKDSPRTVGTRWVAQTVKNITNNMVYAGHMAQGKQIRSLCEGIPRKEMERQDWIIVRNTHTPIVDEDTWNRVQRINSEAKTKNTEKRQLPKTENLLVGMVYCKDCGRTMGRYKNCSRKGHIRYTYCCRIRKASKGMSGCTLKSIGEQELFDIILKSIRIQIAATIEQENLLRRLKAQPEYQKTKRKLESSLAEIQTAISKNMARHAALFESYNDNVVSDEEYLYMKQRYDVQAAELLSRQEQLLAEQVVYAKTLSPENEWIKACRKYDGVKQLSRAMVLELIHHITIEGRNDVHITWNFKDEYQTLISYTEGVQV